MYILTLVLIIATAVSPLTLIGFGNSTCSSSYSEFRCSDGSCVNVTSVCDGVDDCHDSSDEASCDIDANPLEVDHINEDPVHRWKRQTRGCSKNQWRCKDGTCIGFDGKCDGVRDCPDASDEAFPLCRNNKCLPLWFRCTYGACVDGTAPCNNVRDCDDNSDELLPRCRNETERVRGQFTCEDGSRIPAYAHCDGARDCPDGSDETIRACAGKTCASYVFQCAYGACVDAGSDCNGKQDCADGSDESDELCNRIGTDSAPPAPIGACILPNYPAHGSYIVAGRPLAKPGQAFDTVGYNVTCNPGFGVVGNKRERICLQGIWSQEIGPCVRFCRLIKDPSVEFNCLLTGDQIGTRPCGEYEPDGSIVIPECNKPRYYSGKVLGSMRCIDGNWDYVARCQPECGLVTPNGTGLIAGPEGKPAQRGELPWHAGIYRKVSVPTGPSPPPDQICGGSLVRQKVVISAAHCFWKDSRKQPASNYMVALGKIHREWDHPADKEELVQRSEVESLHLPLRFLGSTTNFQDDIAVLVLKETIELFPHIRPVCLDFDITFERRQLVDGHRGKVAGWGRVGANDGPSEILKTIRLPYIGIRECQADAPPDFRVYITGDKICAGFRNGSSLCEGDSGGGLAFSETDERGLELFYLRGIVSTAHSDENLCNIHWLTTFTLITSHEHFIKQFL